MSHFVVWVLGPDPQKQLAPYDENIEVEPYRDVEDERGLAMMAKHYGTTDLITLASKMQDWHGGDQPGGIDEEGRIYHMSTYNPKSRWDWYELGGRWLGSLMVRQGAAAAVGRPGTGNNPPARTGGVDQARKGDIDFDAMEAEARREADRYYGNLEAAVAGLPPATLTWKEALALHPADVDRAREVYGEQPVVQAIRRARLDGFDDDVVRYLRMGREGYVTRSGQHSWVPRAVVRDGEWNEVGRMGWFGLSSDDEDDHDAWAAEVRSVVLNLPPDTLISVFDCHI